jgi:predicted nucleic acid-binding protein
MKMDWQPFIGKLINVTLHENYGLTEDTKNDQTLYEIVFKNGSLVAVYDDGLLLETKRENHKVNIFIPHSSIKCVEMFDLQENKS